MITIEICPICGHDEAENGIRTAASVPCFEVEVGGIQFLASAFVSYDRCRKCGVYIQNPRMTEEHIDRYYREHYRQWLGITQERMDQDEKLRAHQDASIIEKLIGKVNSHLDVGSSRGEFLRHVNAELQVGVEPNAVYNTNAKASIVQALENVAPGQKFELVSMIHSLEHTVDPLSVLKLASMYSSKYLLVEVPSEKSPGGWARLAHTFHFPEETMMLLADEVDFKVNVIYHTPHTFVLMEKK